MKQRDRAFLPDFSNTTHQTPYQQVTAIPVPQAACYGDGVPVKSSNRYAKTVCRNAGKRRERPLPFQPGYPRNSLDINE